MKKISVIICILMIMTISSRTSIYGSSDIEGPSVIHKSSTQVLSLSNILSLYDYDVLVIEDNYTGYGNVPGVYVITLQQGSITKDIEINVVDSWGNLDQQTDILFVTDYKDIYVYEHRVLTLYEMIYYIYSTTGYVDISSDPYYTEYSNSYHSSIGDDDLVPIGDYYLSFKLSYYSGYEAEYTSTIHVIKTRNISGTQLEPPRSNIDKWVSSIPWFIGGVIVILGIKKFKKKGGFKL